MKICQLECTNAMYIKWNTKCVCATCLTAFYQNLEYKLEKVGRPRPQQCPPEVAKPWHGYLMYCPVKHNTSVSIWNSVKCLERFSTYWLDINITILVELSQSIFELLTRHHFIKWLPGGHIAFQVKLKYNSNIPWIGVNIIWKFGISKHSRVIGWMLCFKMVPWWPYWISDQTEIKSQCPLEDRIH